MSTGNLIESRYRQFSQLCKVYIYDSEENKFGNLAM